MDTNFLAAFKSANVNLILYGTFGNYSLTGTVNGERFTSKNWDSWAICQQAEELIRLDIDPDYHKRLSGEGE